MVTPTAVTSDEVVLGLQGVVDPKVRNWIWHAWTQGQLDLVIYGVIKSHNANNNVTAIEYLAHYAESVEVKQKVNWGDISNNTPPNRQLYHTLNELFTGEQHKGIHDHSKFFGVISHVVIPQLLKGNLVDIAASRKKHANKFPPAQLGLFQNSELFLNGAHIHKKYLSPRMWQKLTQAIGKEWDELRQELKRGNIPYHSRTFKRLRTHMEPFYGGHLFKILNRGILEDEYLIFLTLMTWAGILIHYNDVGNTPMFQEIPVLPFNYGVGLGRIDALLVEKINGLAPTAFELYTIGKMAKREFPSVGHIIKALINVFGPNLELVIRDWKFAVGDGTNGVRNTPNVIHTDKVAEKPSGDHEQQIKRYLSTAVLSHSLLSRHHLPDIERIWEAESFKVRGELVYFLPDSLPIIHGVTLLENEIKLVFEEQVTANWKSGVERSEVRSVGSILMSHAINLYVGNNGKGRFKKHPIQHVLNELLETTTVVTSPNARLQELVEKNRKRIYLDQDQLIEVVGENKKKNKKVLQMHLDKVLELIKEGKIVLGKRSDEARGKYLIHCLNPDHADSDPSLNINIPKNVWKCFPCGKGGEFIPSSIPDDWRSIIVPKKKLGYANRQTLALSIPERHQAIMRTAQEILQNSYHGSRGLSYIVSRGLKAQSAYERGVGYADDQLFHGLLSTGYSYEELIQFGFIGISPHVGEYNPLVELFRSHAMKVEDLVRMVPNNKTKGEDPGLPFAVINKMVTYPLEVDGVINSFYGRSIDPNCHKDWRHRKLMIKNMPHGAWNMTKSFESKARFLLVTEAPIDAETFLQWGDIDAGTAIIGVNNELLFEFLADFPGDIIIAFDWDVSKPNAEGVEKGKIGQMNTLKFRDALRIRDFKHQVLDFTAGFVEHLKKIDPGYVYKDFNKYWTDRHMEIRVMDHVIPVSDEVNV